MKKILAVIMTFMLVFTFGASLVSADAFVEEFVSMYEASGVSTDELKSMFSGMGLELNTDTMQITDTALGRTITEAEFNVITAGPSQEDYMNAKQIYVFDIKKDNAVMTTYISGSEGLLYYFLKSSENAEETTYNDEKVVKADEVTVKLAELANYGVGYSEKKGFLTNKAYYFSSIGDLKEAVSSGYTEGTVVSSYVLKFGDKTQNYDITVGKPNSFVYVKTSINWMNLLIVLMCIVVLILIAVTVIIALKSKKKANKKKELADKDFVSEDEVFDELVEEAGIEVIEIEEDELVEDAEDEPSVEVFEKEDEILTETVEVSEETEDK